MFASESVGAVLVALAVTRERQATREAATGSRIARRTP